MQPPIFTLDGVRPTIHPTAWIAPTAAVIGDVTVGEGSSVWFQCVLRGDGHYIRVGARTNIQDGSIIHIATKRFPCIIGDDVSIGHGAIVHACTLENRAFVGMGAIVLDGSVIEEGGMIAAGGLLSPGKRIGRNELWAGMPAKLMRVMSDEERAKWDGNAVGYAALAQRFAKGLG